MLGPVLEWFRDDDGWSVPDGRRGELVGIVLGLPVFAFFATRETGVPAPTESPLAVLLGTICGFCYAVYWRDPLLSRVPERVRNFATGFLFGGGTGLSLLRLVHLAAPTLLFVFAGSVTVAAVYIAWLLWPLTDGPRPPRRGDRPPSAVESSESKA